MLIKYSKAKIVDIIKDAEHNLDDEGTRKALEKAAKKDKKELKETECKKNHSELEN